MAFRSYPRLFKLEFPPREFPPILIITVSTLGGKQPAVPENDGGDNFNALHHIHHCGGQN